MTRRILAAVALLALACTLIAQAPAFKPAPQPRFITYDLLIDSGQTPLAAWQLDIRPAPASAPVELVGVEGGALQSVYAQPAYYDPDALTHDHIVLAAFSTAKPADLPTGRTRVARLHLRCTGDAQPRLAVTLITAADPTGAPIAPTATAEFGDHP